MNRTLIVLYTVFLLGINISGYRVSGWSFGFLCLLVISILCYVLTLNRELKRARCKYKKEELQLQILNLWKKMTVVQSTHKAKE